MTCDCRQGEGDPFVQLYSGSMLVAHMDGTFSQKLACSLETGLDL